MTVWIVDAMNVIGSRPTGWWRDRPGAVRQLLEDSRRFAAATGDEVILVVDGRPAADLPEGVPGAARLVYARRAGADAADDRIVEMVASGEAPPQARVITSDRRLQERLRALGTTVESAGAWRRMFEATVGA